MRRFWHEELFRCIRATRAVAAVFALSIWLTSTRFLRSQEQPTGPEPRRTVTTTFEPIASLASTAEFNKRFRWNEKAPDLDLSQESFQVYVPGKYRADDAYGLLVWISPMAQGGIPSRSWLDVLDDKKLIWVGANKSGNGRPVTDRIRLAIEAVANMKHRYTIDDDRVYVAGFSGGGRSASMAATSFPDVFTGGGIFFGGVNFYRNIPVPGKETEMWRATFYPPPPNLLTEQKRNRRFVLIAGENDFNLSNTIGVFNSGFQKEGYQHATLVRIPGLPHEIPDGQWLAKAVEMLDEPLPKILAARATTRAAATRPATSRPLDEPSDPARDPDKLLNLARSYITAGSYPPARARLQKIIATYPNSTEAKEAARLLDEIRGK